MTALLSIAIYRTATSMHFFTAVLCQNVFCKGGIKWGTNQRHVHLLRNVSNIVKLNKNWYLLIPANNITRSPLPLPNTESKVLDH